MLYLAGGAAGRIMDLQHEGQEILTHVHTYYMSFPVIT